MELSEVQRWFPIMSQVFGLGSSYCKALNLKKHIKYILMIFFNKTASMLDFSGIKCSNTNPTYNLYALQ